ncbi:unnamed protein product [Blepharisma stoltei]|uniref:Uncharacterized protein n=1 Tax=Blepharisma stoltei TaxID=1481888 RepID=A0AAU9IM49_9CILI|nr:unnamed protein product [Blepharisma stoltei]
MGACCEGRDVSSQEARNEVVHIGNTGRGASFNLKVADKSKVPDAPPREEEVIASSEKKLEFSKLNSKDIINAFTAEGMEGVLSRPQLKRAFLSLGLPENDLTSPDAPFYQILAKIKNEKKLYDIRKVALLGLLLGKGSNIDKARLLFKQYDSGSLGSLDTGKVELMVNEIIDLSVNIIPDIAIGEGAGYLTREEEDAYEDRLRARQQNTFNEVKRILISEGQLSESDFIVKMSDSKLPLYKLLSSVGTRALIRSLSNTN